jgi:hypothetical protein
LIDCEDEQDLIDEWGAEYDEQKKRLVFPEEKLPNS